MPAEVPGLIDELPVLAALATLGGGLTVSGAGELRVKESDRITALVAACGRSAPTSTSILTASPSPAAGRSRAASLDAAGDHRLAMAFAIAALGARGASRISGAESVAISYPGFFDTLEGLCA